MRNFSDSSHRMQEAIALPQLDGPVPGDSANFEETSGWVQRDHTPTHEVATPKIPSTDGSRKAHQRRAPIRRCHGTPRRLNLSSHVYWPRRFMTHLMRQGLLYDQFLDFLGAWRRGTHACVSSLSTKSFTVSDATILTPRRPFSYPARTILISCGSSSYDFHGRMRRMFESMQSYFYLYTQGLTVLLYTENKTLTDKDEIENAIKLGEYIKKGASLVAPVSVYR